MDPDQLLRLAASLDRSRRMSSRAPSLPPPPVAGLRWRCRSTSGEVHGYAITSVMDPGTPDERAAHHLIHARYTPAAAATRRAMTGRTPAAIPRTRRVLLPRRAHHRARRLDQAMERRRPALQMDQDLRPSHRPHLTLLRAHLVTGTLTVCGHRGDGFGGERRARPVERDRARCGERLPMDPVVVAAEQQIDGRPATGRRHDDDHRWPARATAGTISPPQGRTPVDQVPGMSLPSAAGWSVHLAGVATREQRRHTSSSHRPWRQARGVTPRREGLTAQSPGHGTGFPVSWPNPCDLLRGDGLCCWWSAHRPVGPAAGLAAGLAAG
jgi:hypothetical protein